MDIRRKQLLGLVTELHELRGANVKRAHDRGMKCLQ